MTSAITFPARIVGLMSGTSADGVDAALVTTDGRELVQTHASLFVPYSEELRAAILALMRGKGDKQAVAHALTEVHIAAVKELLDKSKMQADAIGFHGQTIHHAPSQGITEQIGEAAWMAKALGIPVVADFRSNDVKHGGQGAPLVPLFHAALCSKLAKPVMVVNIGGVANVTWIGGEEIIAFDCGPGNALLDDWVMEHSGEHFDRDGALAAQGRVIEPQVAEWMKDKFFALPPPKSLDRNHWDKIVPTLTRKMSAEDGAATLAAFTAAAIAQATTLVPAAPKQILVTGGGRHNPVLMQMLAARCGCAVAPVETVGWDGDMLEAQAFAYLAARSMQGLDLSLPSTTGVIRPVTGGVFYPAARAGGI